MVAIRQESYDAPYGPGPDAVIYDFQPRVQNWAYTQAEDLRALYRARDASGLGQVLLPSQVAQFHYPDPNRAIPLPEDVLKAYKDKGSEFHSQGSPEYRALRMVMAMRNEILDVGEGYLFDNAVSRTADEYADPAMWVNVVRGYIDTYDRDPEGFIAELEALRNMPLYTADNPAMSGYKMRMHAILEFFQPKYNHKDETKEYHLTMLAKSLENMAELLYGPGAWNQYKRMSGFSFYEAPAETEASETFFREPVDENLADFTDLPPGSVSRLDGALRSRINGAEILGERDCLRGFVSVDRLSWAIADIAGSGGREGLITTVLIPLYGDSIQSDRFLEISNPNPELETVNLLNNSSYFLDDEGFYDNYISSNSVFVRVVGRRLEIVVNSNSTSRVTALAPSVASVSMYR